MHDAQHCQIDNRPSLCNPKKLETQRCSRLPGLVLGAAIIGLMLAPLAAVAGDSNEVTTNQKIEKALDAAAAARSAYATYFAALGPSDSTHSDYASPPVRAAAYAATFWSIQDLACVAIERSPPLTCIKVNE